MTDLKYIAAAVQWSPVSYDAVEGAKKAVAAVEEAASKGAKLVVFPETWLSGYPYFSGLPVPSPEYQAWREAYYNAAVSIPGPEIELIQEAAKERKCTVVIGVTERERGTLYASLVYIGADGALIGKHRKLMPTQAERIVWGMGDGSGLDVYDTPIGRLGGLNCFEHQMAVARHVLADLNIQVHASVWPGHAFINPLIDASTRQLAHENACFVIVAREVMSADRVASGMPSIETPDHWQMTGGSAIIAPGGEYLAEPVFDEETLVMAEMDFSKVSLAKWWFDGAGHYSRPDIFQVRWDRSVKQPVVYENEGN